MDINKPSCIFALMSVKMSPIVHIKGGRSLCIMLNISSGSVDAYSCEIIFLSAKIFRQGTAGYLMCRNYRFVRLSICLSVSPIVCRHMHVLLYRIIPYCDARKSLPDEILPVVDMMNSPCLMAKSSMSVMRSLNKNCILIKGFTEQRAHYGAE